MLFILAMGGRCKRCGIAGGRELEVHHIVPIIDGGEPLALENVEVLCRDCHRSTDSFGGRALR